MLKQATVERVLSTALAGGADFAEIFVEDKDVTTISYVDAKLDRLDQGRDYGLGLRLIKGFEVIYSYTSDLSEESLLELARNAAAALNGEAKQKVLPFHASSRANVNTIKLLPEQIALRQKVDLCAEAHDVVKAYDPLISQASARYLEGTQNVLIANSEGLWVEDARVRTRFAVSAVAQDKGEMQTGFEGPGASMGFEFFEHHDIREIAKEAARVAVTMIKADYAPSGSMPVIMDNAFGGVLFHESCGHGLEASFVSKGTSVYTGKLGQQIASPLVTAIDDGSLPNAWGSSTYDDEGTPTQRNVLIENGVLKSYLVDRLNGKRMGLESTGSCRRQSYRWVPTSRMNNTFIAPGNSTREEIIANTEYGLYAKKLGGGSVDVTTGEFNFAVAEGYLIENGKITCPVRGASLIGTGLEVLQKIDMVGQEFALGHGMCGASSGSIPAALGQPPLRISKLTVGGR
ncbi:MAG: TldD/PmbA family protein [Eubacteriales bacterium]|nr:TldD/PmbA family protein [Eubacteriales bacterium]